MMIIMITILIIMLLGEAAAFALPANIAGPRRRRGPAIVGAGRSTISCKCIYIYIYIYSYVCVCMDIYIYIYTHILYMNNFFGWLETRLAQMTLNYLSIT